MRTMRARVLAAALTALLAATGCSGRKGAAGVVRSSALGIYPQDTVALLVLEVKKVRGLGPETPWLKRMATLADREGGPLRDITRRLGPDVLKQVDRLSLAVVPLQGQKIGYGILAEGRFDAARTKEALGGSDLLTLVEADAEDFSVALLKDGSLALGPRQVLLAMRANGASRGHGLDANPAILTPLEKVRPEAQFWGAVDCRNLQRLFREATVAPDLGGLPIHSAPVQSLVTMAFRGTLGDSVDIDLFGQADAQKNAKNLAEAARGLVAFGRVGAGRDEAREWLDFLDGIRIDQRGADLNLRVSIPAKTMESFVGRMMAPSPPAAEAPSPALGPEQPVAQPRPPAPLPGSASSPAGSPSRPAPEPRGRQTPSGSAP